MATQGAQDGPGTLDEAAAPPKIDPSALVCPGCHEPTDPDVNQCEHCGYLHLGWLVAPSEGGAQPESGDADTARVRLAAALGYDPEAAVGGVLVAIASLVVLCGGLLLHNHYQPLKQRCDSGVGAFAQEVSSSALKHCSLDGFLADMGLVVAILSGFMFVVGVLAVIVARNRRSAPDQPAAS